MTAYNWSIYATDRQTSDDFITTGHWRCTAIDGDFSATSYSTCGFPAGTPAIPYADVTEQNVLDWCWANGVDKGATEAALAVQIEAQKNLTTATGLPWVIAA